jgi:hypothetical protein
MWMTASRRQRETQARKPSPGDFEIADGKKAVIDVSDVLSH